MINEAIYGNPSLTIDPYDEGAWPVGDEYDELTIPKRAKPYKVSIKRAKPVPTTQAKASVAKPESSSDESSGSDSSESGDETNDEPGEKMDDREDDEGDDDEGGNPKDIRQAVSLLS